MTVTNIAGNTRYRSHQWGTQSTLLTPVAATRVMPYRGAININPNRNDVDVDTGSIDPLITPTVGALDITANLTGPGVLAYDDQPSIFGYGCKGGVTPTGGATGRIWTYQVASLTADVFDIFTDEFSDDTASTDGFQAYGGVIDDWTLGFGTDLGVWDVDMNTVYAGVNLQTNKTAALTLTSTPVWTYGGETIVSVDNSSATIGVSPWIDSVHSASVHWSNNLDRKRFANGSNNQTKLGGYGRGPRLIEIVITTGKTTQTVNERATIDDSVVPNRYIQLQATSPTLIPGGSTPYSLQMRYPARLYTAVDGELQGNSTIVFTYHAFYDATLTYAARIVSTNARATL